ncbi:hypothetical protein J3362_16085 [Marinobacter sp. NFXS11]|uniref:hypothetical protein n=1 Tax=Marinobacter sp. NFXS11 TaxID=2818432 RepID=UPI0032DE3938
MTDGVTFSDESRQRSILRKAEYDESELRDLVLNIPKRNGGQITVPLLKKARANIEREDYQENTLLRVKPLAEIESALPVSAGHGAPVNQAKAVALLRPGYLYVFRRGRIWRELEIGSDSKLSDVDLGAIKTDLQSPESQMRVERSAVGEWLDDLLVPVFLQGQAVMHEFRMAYSEVQWDWGYVEKLESDEQALAARTTGIGHAWAVITLDSLSFQSGFPASRVEDLPELRERDLGIELMLENPRDFSPGFERPSDTELCAKLAKRLKSNHEGDDEPIEVNIECEPGQDVLAGLRGQKGLACVALPDPLFRLRHSLAQLQMALHYLDAVDVSIKKNPMAHSAMLIRQAVFDPSPNGNPGALAKYAEAIKRQKLDDVLQASEKDHAVRVIEGHVDELLESMRGRKLDPFFEDYRECSDVAISEAYLLIADKLNVLQQIPGVLNAHGVQSRSDALTGLRQWILNGSFLTDWAPESGSTEETADGAISLFHRLEQLTQDQTEIDGELQNRLNIQSLIYLEKQVKERQGSEDGIARDLSDAGKVGGLVSGVLGEWSSALLTVCKRLIEEGAVQQVEIQRIMQAASSNIVLTSPDLRGIEVMDRAGAVSRGSIVGMLGNGLNRGLTDFDRSEGILTRKNDYLYADLFDESDDLVVSSSPTRAAAAVEEAVNKVAGGTLVFFAPADHPEARKLGLIKVDLAKRVGKVVDGPGFPWVGGFGGV